MRTRLGGALIISTLALLCLAFTSAVAVIALRSPDVSTLRTETASRLAADYGPDEGVRPIAPLSGDLIDAARDDDNALDAPGDTARRVVVIEQPSGDDDGGSDEGSPPASEDEEGDEPTPAVTSTPSGTSTRQPTRTPVDRTPEASPTRGAGTPTSDVPSATLEPKPTDTPEAKPTETPELKPTLTPEPTATPRRHLTAIATLEPDLTPILTVVHTATKTPSATKTSSPTATKTPSPTHTAPAADTPTPTNTSAPTNTPAPTSTNTPIPTNTSAPSNTPAPTSTNTPTPTNTSAPTNTPTSTNTPTPTNTSAPTSTSTPTPTSTPLSPGTLSIEPAYQSVQPGSVFVDVFVTGAANLGGYQFSVGWDAAVLDFAGISNGPFLSSTGNTIVCDAPTVTTGHVDFTCNALLGILGPNGDGTLATIEFTTLVSDGMTTLDLHDSVLTTLLLLQQPSTEVDGYVHVVSEQTGVFDAFPDTHVIQDDPSSSFGGDQELVIEGESGKIGRALIDFNWVVPAGATIVSADITMCIVNTSGGSAGRTHELHRVSSSWDETTDWLSQPSVYPTVSDSIVVSGGDECVSFDVTSDMQALVDGSPCFGWRLNDADETQASGSNTRYASRENGNASDRPVLTVTYIP